jgi:hypothetical protein
MSQSPGSGCWSIWSVTGTNAFSAADAASVQAAAHAIGKSRSIEIDMDSPSCTAPRFLVSARTPRLL